MSLATDIIDALAATMPEAIVSVRLNGRDVCAGVGGNITEMLQDTDQGQYASIQGRVRIKSSLLPAKGYSTGDRIEYKTAGQFAWVPARIAGVTPMQGAIAIELDGVDAE